MAKNELMKNLFLRSIKDARCLACSKRGVDIAHLRPWSKKLNGFGARTHNKHGWFFAIPLCREHHNEIHKKREEVWLEENIEGGRLGAYKWIYEQLLSILPSKCKKLQFDGVKEKTLEGYAAAARELIDKCYYVSNEERRRRGKMARSKGARGERAWVNLLGQNGIKAERLGHIQSSGIKFPDVMHGDYAAQVKNAYHLNIHDAVEQARDESAGKFPYVAWKKTSSKQRLNKDWVVIMGWEEFVSLIKELHDAGGRKAE